MTWFKVDDALAFHRKSMKAGNAAMGLWVRAGSWCAQQLNDGRIPPEIVAALGTQAEADALVRAELWHETMDGYEFHDWAEYQPTRESVLEKREKTAERVADWRSKKRAGNAVTNDVVTLPPTRPDPTRKRESAARPPAASKKGSRLPADFSVDEQLLQYTLENAPSIDVKKELENFRDYWDSVAGAKGVKLDWRATWRTWVRRSHERAIERGWKAPASGAKDTQSKLDSWLAARGVSRTEYELHKSETGWLESLREIK